MSAFRRDFLRDGEVVQVRVEPLGDEGYRVRVGGQVLELQARALEHGAVQFALKDELDGASRQHIAWGCSGAERMQVRLDGRTWTLERAGGRRGVAARHADGQVFAPMTGTVLQLKTKVGDAVEADHTLVVLSAMKMEHKLTAGVAGTVKSVQVAEGAAVDQGALLVEVEPAQQ